MLYKLMAFLFLKTIFLLYTNSIIAKIKTFRGKCQKIFVYKYFFVNFITNVIIHQKLLKLLFDLRLDPFGQISLFGDFFKVNLTKKYFFP